MATNDIAIIEKQGMAKGRDASAATHPLIDQESECNNFKSVCYLFALKLLIWFLFF